MTLVNIPTQVERRPACPLCFLCKSQLNLGPEGVPVANTLTIISLDCKPHGDRLPGFACLSTDVAYVLRTVPWEYLSVKK